ncbi:hypothetical protein AB0D12_31470 [Streptomyces sp. NPDC048479]|uniref:hypothetical protein n=1 Tax=Streptomyces sp. NPDC048479 TaxID=3154725 RepID=UPI0034407945
MPTLSAATQPAEPPRACLLHADVHHLAPQCWQAYLEWEKANDHLEAEEVVDAYEAAAERRMLDQLTREHLDASAGRGA